MFNIQQITNDALQKQTLLLQDGSSVKIKMRYSSQQYGWFFDEISYLDFTLYGVRITNNLNMLMPYRHQIPFGLACISDDDREPTQKDDFASRSSRLYILSDQEVDDYVRFLSGQV